MGRERVQAAAAARTAVARPVQRIQTRRVADEAALPTETGVPLAPRFGHDFRQVRVHAAPPMIQRQCPGGNCHDRYRDDERRFPRDLMPEPQPQQPQQPARLKFFHGTRWSVARTIPRNVRAVGGGDFAAGFYTHHDANERVAHFRALQWACRVARDAREKYGGVIKFDVDAQRYRALSHRTFNLTSLDQPDYAARQADWIDFVTTFGRQSRPVFQQRRRRGVWIHPRRDPPPALSHDVVSGPFYQPIPGTPDRQPGPSEFEPFSERRNLPQQVVFANRGCDLLNDASTAIELKQHECDPLTGNVVEPPDNGPAAAAGTPSGQEVPMIE
jgi:hypothetical protein